MSKEKETKKATTKETAKKPKATKTAANAKATTPTKEDKAADAKNVYTREVEDLMQEFIENYEIEQNLTGTDRRRLTGAGVRNNGFIDKAA